METERIALNQRERDRLKVLHEVEQKHLTQTAAAGQLNVSDRQVRRMLLRIAEHGDGALVHGLRGRRSNRKLAARFEQKVLARVGQRYADFGPTLAAEHLAKDGLLVSRETLRKWMSKANFWQRCRQRVKKIHVWRERRACFEELMRLTRSFASSFFLWNYFRLRPHSSII
jgi:Homeodomain-like domain